MLSQREFRMHVKRAVYEDESGMNRCCWSCRNSEVSQDLDSLICLMDCQKKCANDICKSYLHASNRNVPIL